MLFRRRTPPGLRERIRVWLWPRRNWSRSSRYFSHRLRRLHASPHAIGLGCAAGVFASFTPFLGAHIILAAILAWMTRANILASALGTFFGNPVTYPFIWYVSYQLGTWMLGLNPKAHNIDLSPGIFHKSFDQIWPIIKPMIVGGLPLGVIAGSAAYFLIKKAAEAYHNRPSRGSHRSDGAGAAAQG